ncbi:CPBP family intramembrane glutamic endopeptidase [Cytobacillus sp. NCCP-133]|uniref:CPBP family intramembrane glutamic endopeptidase n=1 Tax=Cytobacillus sp. NCCP-133 TaxID=766848 RepID=UPI002232023C|nr:CPBP family intramembrane glutamic endopeptidase [Cytobacillus sp. NCCP-133]GLB58030.1 CAAX amino protease [Cytobacillus sp. NCCP-133]
MKKNYTDIIRDLTDKELLFHLYITQILLLIISFILGILLFDSLSDFLDLFRWNDLNILLVGGTAGVGVVAFDLIMMKLLPESLYDDGGLNERIFKKRSLLHIAIIAAVVAFCEELLFRGIIQTHFGLAISSLIFALVHYRYLFNWFLFINIITLSFFIGYIYLVTENLLVTIIMHFLIDFLLGVMIRISHSRTIDESVSDKSGIN